MKKINYSIIALLSFSIFSLSVNAQTSPQLKIERVRSLVSATNSHGLISSLYLNPSVEAGLQTMIASGDSAGLDNRLNSIVTRLASDLSRGRILPSKAGNKVYIKDKPFEHQVLVNSYLNGSLQPDQFINVVAPQNRYYYESKNVLSLLRSYKINNSWITRPSEVVLATVSKKTTNPKLIAYLRLKLNSLGYINDATSTVYDSGLESAIKIYQAENGLGVDGVVGNMSWQFLEKSLDQLISQAILNLDRTRWLPSKNPMEYIYVNLARQTFEYIQNESEVLSFKTINGRVDRQTPLLVDSSTHIILNPTWTVPRSIFVKDKLPKLRENAGYAAQMHMRVVSDVNGREVDPYSVNWNRDPENLPYTLVQKPGPRNALGFIKFPLTNPYAIYLHDTSDRQLFAESNRLLSSGCMRLEKPFEVAEKLLSSPVWTVDSLKSASEYLSTPAQKPTTVNFKRGVPVFAAYKTILVNKAGRLVSANDPYDLDKTLYSKMISGQ
jgi:L,D-transpeptidase YcbB